jgi:hypothetical protein
MAFTGVFTAPKITPSAFGLLAVVKPENGPDEDKWIRGFSQEWDTDLFSAKLWDDTDTTDDTVASNATPNRHDYIKPFFIEVEENISAMSFLAIDRIERVKRQLDGVTQKSIEKELCDGVIRLAESHENEYLRSANVTVLNSGTALSARRALALLEHSIAAASPTGEQGVIHMTRDVMAVLSSNSNMLFHDAKKDHIQTMGGTPVVVGSGYSGDAPTGVTGAGASATNKWMYATGTVKTFLGNIDVVNDNLAQAYDVSGNQNDMRLKAIRPAAVYFDTSIHLAIRVDLTS